MSGKAAVMGLLRRGKQVLQTVLKTKTQKAPVKVGDLTHHQQIVRFRPQVQPAQQARSESLLRKAIPNVYINSLARALSRRAALRGRNVPVWAFMGFVMANTADQKEEHTLTEMIQSFIKGSGSSDYPLEGRPLCVDQFQFGGRIGQGCSAAVYEARLNEADLPVSDADSDISILSDCDADVMESEASPATAAEHMEDAVSEAGSDITVPTDDGDLEDANCEIAEDFPDVEIIEGIPDDVSDDGSDFSLLDLSDVDVEEDERAPMVFYVDRPDTQSEADSDIEVIDDTESSVGEEFGNVNSNIQLCSRTMSPAGLIDVLLEEDTVPPDIWDQTTTDVYNSLDSSVSLGQDRQRYNLAVKLMFNYDAESNAASILRQMHKETLPARVVSTDEQTSGYGHGQQKRLPPHPNIVEMWGVFVDPFPQLPDGLTHYPAALPPRINPSGAGRNMTLFLVMKKYSMTLEEYLSMVPLMSMADRVMLLAQLLEAVAHLRKNGVAHRDIKADNILVDINTDGSPRLVLTDFGCCLAGHHDLKVPFQTDEVDRGGNTALMAPEIACAVPGMLSVLDYRKSDLWSVGAIAYQILGADNPFYGQAARNRLDSRTYRESELPALPDGTPTFVQQLILSLLSREPNQRTTARLAADLLHLYLWLPGDWLQPGSKVQRSDVDWWLVTMAAEVMVENWFVNKTTQASMKRSFLESLNMNNLKDCLAAFGCELYADI